MYKNQTTWVPLWCQWFNFLFHRMPKLMMNLDVRVMKKKFLMRNMRKVMNYKWFVVCNKLKWVLICWYTGFWNLRNYMEFFVIRISEYGILCFEILDQNWIEIFLSYSAWIPNWKIQIETVYYLSSHSAANSCIRGTHSRK